MIALNENAPMAIPRKNNQNIWMPTGMPDKINPRPQIVDRKA